MKKYEKILNSLKYKSPLPLLYENGYTPETIKAEILADFAPFFKNKKNLKKYAIDFLVSDWINFLRIGIKYPNIHEDIKLVVDSYNKAKLINEHDSLVILAKIMPLHIDGGNKFWSFLNLEVPKLKLELEEFTHTSMKDISDIVEGISKSLYIEQVLINRIIRNKPLSISNVVNNKLGNLIEELATNSAYSHLFITEPEKMKLSDWRNIASHHTYSIKKGFIYCEYGEKEKKKTVILNREQLFEKVEHCMRTTEALSMAHKFYGFDNMDKIQKLIRPTDKEPREEMEFLIFSSGLMSQGFELKNIDYKEREDAILILQDLTNDDPIKRGIHSSQFLLNLWNLTERPLLTVIFKTSNGNDFLTSKCNSEVCELVATGKKKFSYLAQNVEFIRHKNSG